MQLNTAAISYKDDQLKAPDLRVEVDETPEQLEENWIVQVQG